MVDRPDIKTLQRFAREYLPGVRVEWRRMRNAFGQSFVKKRLIYLHPHIPLVFHNLELGRGAWLPYPKELKFEPGEQYFYVLLHEVGHFLAKISPPKYFFRIKKSLEEDYPRDREMQILTAQDRIERRKNESDERWQGRIFEFETWLAGSSISEHIETDNWGMKEFNKKRKEIKRLLESPNPPARFDETTP